MNTDLHERPNDDTPEVFNPRRAMLAGLGGLAAGALLASTASAGPLTPPAGAISSTPGPEPRIPINSTNTPGSSGTSSVFRITQPGSYYLTANINSLIINRHVIVVAADRVTLDLNGFSVRGLGTIQGQFDCIFAESGNKSITVKNGFVELAGRYGVNLDSAAGCAVEGISVSGSSSSGIRVGASTRITDCIARANGHKGIHATEASCTLSNCTATSNGQDGITTTGGCTIKDCTSNSNTWRGIWAGNGCTITNCTTRSNGLSGISVIRHGTITNCVTTSNGRHGLSLDEDCFAENNTCSGNGTLSLDSGICVWGAGNRIDGNNCTRNTTGIYVDQMSNFIARNTCSGNTTNWNISAGNACLVVVATTSGDFNGNSGGVSPGSSNPNANFTLLTAE